MSRDQCKHQTRATGYTLMELLLVLTILAGAGFILLMKIPQSLESQALDLASTQLVEDLREAKQAAVTENIWYQLSFYADNTYAVNRQVQRIKTMELPKGVRFASLPQDKQIIFAANGTPSKSGTIVLEYKGKLKRVIVAPVGGRIREE